MAENFKMKTKVKEFIYYYLRSMRLYYSFVTGVSTLAGVVAAMGRGAEWNGRVVFVLATGFLAWGVNQIFSDYCDREEDSLNAPHRAMVTGKLAVRPALMVSVILMVIFALGTAVIAPLALLVLVAGGVLNLGYSWSKHLPVVNAVIYGAAISCCAVYGWLGAGGVWSIDMLKPALWMFPAHVIMCSYSYYKDAPGDRAVGIRTLANMLPERVSLPLMTVSSMLYTVVLGFYCDFNAGGIILLCGQMVVIALLTYCLYARYYHRATRFNCELCVIWLWGLIVCNSAWWWIGIIVSLLTIELIFRWYRDEKE